MNLLGRGAALVCFVMSTLLATACANKPSAASPATPSRQAPPSAGGDVPGSAAPASKAPGGASQADHRPPTSLGVAQASNDVETAQRELDVAAGDCRNACRALGSMDRAAGRLCSLAQSGEETRRCEDAKNRVYSARDKVKATCGTCNEVTVDRNAPIPSR